MPQPPPTNSAQLGAAIRILRKSRGMTIEGLAGDAGIHWTHLSRIENGRRRPTWEVVVALAAALEVDMGELASLAARQPAP